jgi:hypothetical protein
VHTVESTLEVIHVQAGNELRLCENAATPRRPSLNSRHRPSAVEHVLRWRHQVWWVHKISRAAGDGVQEHRVDGEPRLQAGS